MAVLNMNLIRALVKHKPWRAAAADAAAAAEAAASRPEP